MVFSKTKQSNKTFGANIKMNYIKETLSPICTIILLVGIIFLGPGTALLLPSIAYGTENTPMILPTKYQEVASTSTPNTNQLNNSDYAATDNCKSINQ
jgi:hypothetical protein